MRNQIPQNGIWSGGFPGEQLGSFYMSNGIDLERYKGKISLGETFTAINTDADVGASNITVAPIAFVRTSADGTDRWWAVTGGGLVKNTDGTNPQATYSNDALANSPTAPLYDAIEFKGALLVATSTDIARLSTTWTAAWFSGLTGAATLTANAHRFTIFAGALIFTDKNFIHTYDGTLLKSPALTLPQNFNARWIRNTNDYCYIGGANVDGSEATIYFWDKSATFANAQYGCGDIEAVAGFTARGIPYIITLNGAIKRFTGQGFRTVNQFPTVELNKTIGGNGASPTGLHPNGVTVDENIVKIFVNFGVLADLRLLSGVWTFDVNTNNLYHSGSIKNNVAKDYAQLELSAAGAMKSTVRGKGRWLVGGTAFRTYNSTTRIGIFSSDESTTSGRGWIMTTKIPSGNVKRYIRELILKFKRLNTSTNRIRLLYRTQEDNTLPTFETITWVNSTSFTGSDATATTGDFVEILAGDNAGALAKITNKTGASAPFTFTIDLTLNSSTIAARAVYYRFTDAGTISSQAVQNSIMRIAQRSEWIQFIIELRGTQTSPAIEGLILDSDEIPR